jgi:ribosome-binding factor A
MAHGSRPARIGDQIRLELSELLARQVKDPGVGFVTIVDVRVTPDLQIARVYYTSLGDEQARAQTRRALDRALPFLRRQVGQRLQLRRVPELEFFYDETIERADRIERIIRDLHAQDEQPPGEGAADASGEGAGQAGPDAARGAATQPVHGPDAPDDE